MELIWKAVGVGDGAGGEDCVCECTVAVDDVVVLLCSFVDDGVGIFEGVGETEVVFFCLTESTCADAVAIGWT